MIEIKRSLLRHFGVEPNQFYWDRTLNDYMEEVVDAIDNNQMLFITGDKGCGKNILHEKACENFSRDKMMFVDVRNYYKEKLGISSIINACIYDLSDNPPRRDLEARSRQFIRLVGAKFVNEKKHVSILINEGHRIHANTYRALKELREAKFNGIGPLFSVVVTGHPELAAKIKEREEVLWRCQSINLEEEESYYSLNMRINYIKKLFGSAITDEAGRRIAAICKGPLHMNFFIEKKMEEARRAGKKVLDGEAIQPSNAELKEALGLSLQQIASEGNIGKTTVSDILHNPSHPQSPVVTKAIERLQEKMSGKKVAFSKSA